MNQYTQKMIHARAAVRKKVSMFALRIRYTGLCLRILNLWNECYGVLAVEERASLVKPRSPTVNAAAPIIPRFALFFRLPPNAPIQQRSPRITCASRSTGSCCPVPVLTRRFDRVTRTIMEIYTPGSATSGAGAFPQGLRDHHTDTIPR